MSTSDYEKTVLQQISDVAWLVHRGEQELGVLNKDIQEHYTYLGVNDQHRVTVTFNDADEVKKHFGNLKLFEMQINRPVQKQDAYYIRGYEVNYPDPYAIEPDDPAYRDDLPLYTKIKGSDIYYAAGYYCIGFETGWRRSFGPKLATMLKYGYVGPFRTEAAMKAKMKELNRELRRSKKND